MSNARVHLGNTLQSSILSRNKSNETNSELLKCLECGSSVSADATRCPHCHSHHFKGVNCLVCSRTLKESDAVTISQNATDKFLHPACFEAVGHCPRETIKKTCPVCQTQSKFDSQAYQVACTKCGHIIQEQPNKDYPYCLCYYCEFFLNKRLEVNVGGSHYSSLYAHRACLTPARKAEWQKWRGDKTKRLKHLPRKV